eukprot:scaffold616_cov257-Pinguiococcus_pyrenoidosus.AAC.10
MDNLPALKSAIQQLPGPPCSAERTTVLTTLGGDFLAPSLLSTIDHGRSMVEALNAIPVDIAMFGNHEADIPMQSLRERVREFSGVWLNSNMPALDVEGLRRFHEVFLPGGRRVVFAGLVTDEENLYRDGSFDSAREKGGWISVPDALQELVQDPEILDGTDLFVPITHQTLEDDIDLAHVFDVPLLLGGHDHFPVDAVFNNTRIVKAAADAKNVMLVDIVWKDESVRRPTITTNEVRLAAKKKKSKKAAGGGEAAASNASQTFVIEPNEELLRRIEEWEKPAMEMRAATLMQFDVNGLAMDIEELVPADTVELSSVGARTGPNTMATLIATALREACGAEGALVNAGNVRGNKVYRDGTLTFGDLNSECPFPSINLAIRIDPETLRDAILWSRKTWLRSPGTEDADALHTDADMQVNETSHVLDAIGGERIEQRLYRIVVDTYILKTNPVLSKYAQEYPDRIPAIDIGQPALPLLLNYFCHRAWRFLVDTVSERERQLEDIVTEAFSLFDVDHSGSLDLYDLLTALERGFGEGMATPILARQMLQIIDANHDGAVNLIELTSGLLL